MAPVDPRHEESHVEPSAPRRHWLAHDDHLDARLSSLRDALRAARQGDFSIRLPTDGEDGVLDEIALAFNGLIEQNEALVAELDRVHGPVALDGDTHARAALPAAPNAWALAITSINSLI